MFTKMKNYREELEERLLAKAMKDEEFRRLLLWDPKTTVEKELGIALPGTMKIKVVEEKEGEVCLVLPASAHPDGEIAVEELEGVAGGWSGDGCSVFTDCGC